MNDESAFLEALQQHPEDNALRLVFADWLDERGDMRGELIRLLHTLTQSVEVPDRQELEDRQRSLLAEGVQSVGPFWTNSIGMKFAWVPAGTFLMGSPPDEEGRKDCETQHKVTLTKGLWLGVHQVTQASWLKIMGDNPSARQGEDLPVEQVSWEDCKAFLHTLSSQEDMVYRLPTETEWEYSCRAGTTTPFYFGASISPDQANYNGRDSYGGGKTGVDRGSTTRVGSFPANGWGLHDMHGNVHEWCADWFGEYPKGDVVDPKGPESGDHRLHRGGSFTGPAMYVRSARRVWYWPSFRVHHIGFRVAMTFS